MWWRSWVKDAATKTTAQGNPVIFTPNGQFYLDYAEDKNSTYVTAEKVKNEFLGHSESHETILSLFQKHNDDVKQLVGCLLYTSRCV